jgi:hypothetical protein
MSATTHLVSFIPSEDDVKLAKEAKKILAPRLSSTSPFDLRTINPLKEPSVRIPAQAAHLLVQILDEMSRGGQDQIPQGWNASPCSLQECVGLQTADRRGT